MIDAGDHGGRVKVLDFGLASCWTSRRCQPGATMPPRDLTVEGRVARHGRLHVARAGGGRARRRAVRSVFARRDPVRDGDGRSGRSRATPASRCSRRFSRTRRLRSRRSTRRCPRNWAASSNTAWSKDPARRYQTAADLRNDLEELKHDLDSGSLAVSVVVAPPAARPPKTKWIVAGAAVVLAIVSAAVYRVLPPRVAAGRPAAGPERTFAQLTTLPGLEEFPSLSPDGKWIAYRATRPATPTSTCRVSAGTTRSTSPKIHRTTTRSQPSRRMARASRSGRHVMAVESSSWGGPVSPFGESPTSGSVRVVTRWDASRVCHGASRPF